MNNRYGLDSSYFCNKMSRIIRDIGNYKPEEFARECARMSRTADESIMREAEFQPQPAAHLTIPGALEWDGDNGTHGADGESRDDGESEGVPSAYTAVDMTTAAADGFRDGLAAFSEDGKRNVLAEVFFQKGDDPFICAVRGRVCVEQLEAAQRDFRENLPDVLEQGDGIYTFDFFYEKGQHDEFGRCEIAPGWGFDFVSYAAFEVGDEPVIEPEAFDDIPDFTPGSGNKAKRRIAEIEKAKQKTCAACDGWGTISTGIDEAPSTSCNKCDGTGKVAP